MKERVRVRERKGSTASDARASHAHAINQKIPGGVILANKQEILSHVLFKCTAQK